MWSRIDLKERAKFNLRAFYWKSVLVAFILSFVDLNGGNSNGSGHSENNKTVVENFFSNNWSVKWLTIILSLASIIVIMFAILTIASSIFLLNPLEVSCKKYFLDASYGNSDLQNLGFSFKNNYMNIVVNIFLRNLFIFLWTLVLVVPGIVKAYEYRMIPYLLCENPSLTFREAKSLSSQMMYGEKLNAFVLDLSFLLWHLLSGITLGLVGIFWVAPYTAYTNVELYRVLAGKISENNDSFDSI